VKRIGEKNDEVSVDDLEGLATEGDLEGTSEPEDEGMAESDLPPLIEDDEEAERDDPWGDRGLPSPTSPSAG
jgi:hypothetical protein